MEIDDGSCGVSGGIDPDRHAIGGPVLCFHAFGAGLAKVLTQLFIDPALFRHGQSEDKGIRVDITIRKPKKSAKSNWEYEDVDQKQVKRIHDRQKIKAYLPERILEARKNIKMEGFVFHHELQQLIVTHKGLLNLKALKPKQSMNFYWQLFTLLKLMEGAKDD